MYISASPPDAPPLSDTTIGCFMRLFFWIAACIIRAIWSEAPPAPAATTISTGLVGSHALPAATPTIIASAPAVLTNLFMSAPPPSVTHRGGRCGLPVRGCNDCESRLLRLPAFRLSRFLAARLA